MSETNEELIAEVQGWCPFCNGSGMVMTFEPEDCPNVSIHSALAALVSRPVEETGDWEYGVGYEGDNGVEVKWFSLRSGGFTIREAAENELNLYTADPQVQLIRRRPAGPWVPVVPTQEHPEA